jgi:hypothetical protein
MRLKPRTAGFRPARAAGAISRVRHSVPLLQQSLSHDREAATDPGKLELVRSPGWRGWPPRLPGQPSFCPVLNQDYAAKIARDWNAPRSGAGYVARFRGPRVLPASRRWAPSALARCWPASLHGRVQQPRAAAATTTESHGFVTVTGQTLISGNTRRAATLGGDRDANGRSHPGCMAAPGRGARRPWQDEYLNDVPRTTGPGCPDLSGRPGNVPARR